MLLTPLAIYFHELTTSFNVKAPIINTIRMEKYPPWLSSVPPAMSFEDISDVSDSGDLLHVFRTFQSLVNVPDINGETPIFYVS